MIGDYYLMKFINYLRIELKFLYIIYYLVKFINHLSQITLLLLIF